MIRIVELRGELHRMLYADLFPPDYATARDSFVRAVERAGARLESHPHPSVGRGGEPLFLDVARIGAPESEATRVLFVGCGTHGVEGRVGSGILGALLAHGSFGALRRGFSVVLVHAINPYGFAHDRRVDHENVDVNRNFIDHSKPHPENPHYEVLRPFLNPEVDDAGELGAEAVAALALYGALRGARPMLRGAMGGQYRHPAGMQYGGIEPCWSNRTMHAIWARHVPRGVQLAVFIDIHSGLGPRGEGTILEGAEPDDPRAALARRLFGRVHRTPRPSPERTITFGELATAFEDASAARRSLGVILEFGTYDPLTVFSALRADAWLARRGDPRSVAGRKIKRRLRDAFFIDDAGFRGSVIERGIEVVEDAIAGIATA